MSYLLLKRRQDLIITLCAKEKDTLLRIGYNRHIWIIHVFVEILTGPLFYVEVSDDATVSDLKLAIEAEKSSLDIERFILILGNKKDGNLRMDDDEAPVADYGVADGSHVYLFFKLTVKDDSLLDESPETIPDLNK